MDISHDQRMLARFFKKVQKGDGCHIWTGSLDTGGYGCFNVNRKTMTTHRLAYGIAYGDFDESMHVDHICHNRACVNPGHLRLTTRRQNAENRSGPARHGKSGVRGVSWHSQANRWWVQAGHKGRKYSGGLYDSLDEAEQAAIELRNRLHTHNYLDRLVS